MYRIALCDDEPNELNKTRMMLDRYRTSHLDDMLEVQEFPSMEALIAHASIFRMVSFCVVG